MATILDDTVHPAIERKITITWDQTADGWVAFLGPKEEKRKLAVMGTKHDQGMRRADRVILEPMPKETWSFHFTRPVVKIEELKALLDSLPAEA